MIKKRGWLHDLKKNKVIYLMFLPLIIHYLAFQYAPMFGISIAFLKYRPARGFLASEWVGFANFLKFFNGPYALRLIRNTLLINVYQLLWGFPVPIIFALLLNELNDNWFKRTMQTLSYLPHFISVVVACGIIRLFVQSGGLITTILSNLGLIQPADLLADAKNFRTIYISSGIWQGMGWGSIIYLATLSTVDVNLYEAAMIDGAGRFKRMWSITLPALIPIIVVQLIMRIGHIMSEGSQKIILLYRPITYETSDIISSYVYRAGLIDQDFSTGTAIGLFNSVINVILLVSANYISRRLTEQSMW